MLMEKNELNDLLITNVAIVRMLRGKFLLVETVAIAVYMYLQQFIAQIPLYSFFNDNDEIGAENEV